MHVITLDAGTGSLRDADENLTASARFIPDAPEPSNHLASLDEVGMASPSRSDVTDSDALWAS